MRTIHDVVRRSAGSGGEPETIWRREALPRSGDHVIGIDRLPQNAREVIRVEIVEETARDDNDGDVTCLGVRSDFALNVHSAEAWKAEVEQNPVRWIGIEPPQSAQPIVNRDDGVTGHDEDRAIERAQLRIILDDEDGRLTCRGHASVFAPSVPASR